MARRTLLTFLCLATTIVASTMFNLEELESTTFSIDIVDQPLSVLKLSELEKSEDVIHMKVASKHGQKYMCSYKDASTLKEDERTDDSSTELKITDLLESMRGNCLFKNKDWWSYEFCYGEEVTQFHLHNGQKTGDIISLGKYSHDYKWSTEDAERMKRTVNRYHTQQYVNGSICDLTNKARRTEVRFSCIEGEIDHLGAITEHEACAYVLFVYTSKVCHHPYLKPTKKYKPSVIQCQPIVSQTTYEKYLHNQEIAKERQKQLDEQQLKRRAEDEAKAMLKGGTVGGEPGLDMANIKQNLKQQISSILNFEGLDDLDIDFVDFESLQEELEAAMEEQQGVEEREVQAFEEGAADEPETAEEFIKRARSILNTEKNQKMIAELTGKPLEEVKTENDALQKRWEEEDMIKREAALNAARGRLDRETLAAQAPDKAVILNGQDITESLKEVLTNEDNLRAISKHTGKSLEELSAEIDRIHRKWVKQMEEIETIRNSDTSDEAAFRKHSETYMENIRELLEFRNKIRAALNEGQPEDFPEEVKGPIGMYKENLRHILSAQFEDIIAKTKQEMEAAGEDVSDVTDQYLRQRMTEFVNSKLNEMEANEKAAYEEVKKKAASQQPVKPRATKPRRPQHASPIKIEIVEPQKLEMEVVDSDAITPDHEYYDAVQKQTQALGLQEEAAAQDGVKKIIAFIKPMQPRGSRKEEKSHNKLSQNYNRKWTNHDEHDEL